MSQIINPLKNILSIPKLESKPSQERRASVFGMVESGKTTILGLLEITCVNLANQANLKTGKYKGFRFLVQERTSGIRQSSSDLRKGMFPKKTPPDHVFEADFLMRKKGIMDEKFLRLPFCETAGEEITKLLKRFEKGEYEVTADMFQDAGAIHEYILDSDAIIVIAPVTRAAGIEEEKGTTIKDPDVNISRLLSAIYAYKDKIPESPRIRALGVFLTKYDALREVLESKGMNLKTQDGVHRFMSKYFPETYAVLGWYGLENVKFWPTGVEIETEKNELGQVVAKLHPLNPERGYKIKVDSKSNVPRYTQQEFIDFVDWCLEKLMA
jgi:hypothetical protein